MDWNMAKDGFLGMGILGVCLAFVRMMNGRLRDKVDKDACHTAQDAVKGRIDSLEKHMDDKFDDMKFFIKQENGGGK